MVCLTTGPQISNTSNYQSCELVWASSSMPLDSFNFLGKQSFQSSNLIMQLSHSITVLGSPVPQEKVQNQLSFPTSPSNPCLPDSLTASLWPEPAPLFLPCSQHFLSSDSSFEVQCGPTFLSMPLNSGSTSFSEHTLPYLSLIDAGHTSSTYRSQGLNVIEVYGFHSVAQGVEAQFCVAIGDPGWQKLSPLGQGVSKDVPADRHPAGQKE